MFLPTCEASMKKIILLISVLLTASCNIQPAKKLVTIKDRLQVGSSLSLTQKLVIPKDRTFIYIANGKVAPLKDYNTVDVFEPYCMFFVEDEVSQDTIISPDTFEVTDVLEWEGYYSQSTSGFMNAVDNTNFSGRFIKVDGDRGDIMYATIISLRSKKQKEVKKLVCGHWDDYYRIEPLSFEQLKTTLGNLITIEVNNKMVRKGTFI